MSDIQEDNKNMEEFYQECLERMKVLDSILPYEIPPQVLYGRKSELELVIVRLQQILLSQLKTKN